jgi:hypothetical protein
MREIAEEGTIGHAYVAYSVLSGDSSHPSLKALKRHLCEGEGGSARPCDIDVEPTPDKDELSETLFLACMALLGASVGTNQVFGGVPAGEELKALSNEFIDLRKAREENFLPRAV